MNPEVKALWVDALRSGDYVQGARALKTKENTGEPRYCCLGVLCDVAIKNGVNLSEEWDASINAYTYDGSDLVLPHLIVKWAGLAGSNPDGTQLPESGINREFALAELNDGVSGYNVEPWTFTQIADLIEEKF